MPSPAERLAVSRRGELISRRVDVARRVAEAQAELDAIDRELAELDDDIDHLAARRRPPQP